MNRISHFLIKFLLILLICVVSCWVFSKPGWDSISSFILTLFTYFTYDLQNSNIKENKHDIDLYNRLLEILPTEGSISYLRNTDMARVIDTDIINSLYHFALNWSNPEYKFKDSKMERSKVKLIFSIKEFMMNFSRNTFQVHSGKNAIPQEWSENNPSRYNTTRELLNKLADDVVQHHARLILLGKKRLLT